MKLPSCGLLFGSDIHHLDHIAPFCDILGIPLVCTDIGIDLLAKQTYPNLEVKHVDLNQLASAIVPDIDVIYSCLPTQLLEPIFSFEERKLRKKLLFAWLPHGNSDKDNLEALLTEKYLLIYGKQMKDILTRKEVLKKVEYTTIGNFRKSYYLANKDALDQTVLPHITFKKKGPKTILYAPTWGNQQLNENSYALFSNFPDNYNLIVKFHPNTLYTGFAIALKEAFFDKPNIKFIDDIAPIYPLLTHADIYVGDHSSIAYDFLSLNKPLYFFAHGKTPIHHTGIITTPENLIHEIENNEDHHEEARKTLNEYAFEPTPPLETLPSTINHAISQYFEKEPHILE